MHPEQAEQSGEACWALLCRRYQASARSSLAAGSTKSSRPRSPGAMASASAGDGSDHAIERGGHNSGDIEPWPTGFIRACSKGDDGPGKRG